MIKFSQKQLKELIKIGAAINVTNAKTRTDIPENYTQIGYSCGVYGCNGQLFIGEMSHKLYATTSYNYSL